MEASIARSINEQEYATRRSEILDAAQYFIFTRGYDRFTIQDILDRLHISKGAFYHYFASKGALLEALVKRSQEQALELLLPALQDANQPVLEKLARLFDTAARWKVAQKSYMLALLRSWYADENAILRQKMVSEGQILLTPSMSAIIEQGTREGVMHTAHPAQAGTVAVSLMISMGDAVGRLLLALEPESSAESRHASLQNALDTTAAYTDAIERVIGVSAGSLALIDRQTLEEWFSP